MAEADVVDAELEMLAVLHDSHRVVHDVEGVCEGTLKLLLVCYHYPVSHDSSPSTQLGG